MAATNGPNTINTNLTILLDPSNTRSYIGSGTTINDIGGSNDNGTLVNSPYFDPISTYISLDGSTQYISLSTPQFVYGSASRTISIWAYSLTSSTSWAFSYGTGSVMSLGISGSNYYFSDLSATGATISRWYNLVGTYDTTIASLYSNGVLIATASKSWNTQSLNAQIGVYNNSTGYWKGYISNFSFYNRALSSTEIAQNYNSSKSRFGKAFVPLNITYATFDSTLYGAGITRNSSTQVTNNGAGNATALATINGSTTGKSSGKWYWEYTYTLKTNQAEFGIMSGTSDNLSGALGSTLNGWGFYSIFGGWWVPINNLQFSFFTIAGPTTINQGDIIGVALDAGGNKITFYINNVQVSPAATAISGGNYVPAVGLQTNGGTIVANFGASPFIYTPPAGYNSGYY